MKKVLAIAATLVFGAAICLADQFTGWITDQKCAASGKFQGAEHKKCVEGGQPVVFVNDADQKVYMISEPDKVKDHIGEKVTLQGTAKANTIQVESVAAAQAGGQ